MGESRKKRGEALIPLLTFFESYDKIEIPLKSGKQKFGGFHFYEKSLYKRKRAVVCLFVLYYSLRYVTIFNDFDALEFWRVLFWKYHYDINDCYQKVQ